MNRNRPEETTRYEEKKIFIKRGGNGEE